MAPEKVRSGSVDSAGTDRLCHITALRIKMLKIGQSQQHTMGERMVCQLLLTTTGHGCGDAEMTYRLLILYIYLLFEVC